MDLTDGVEDLDLTLRHVTRQFPEHLARALLPAGTVVTSARWTDTQITARQRRLDRALEVAVGVERRLELTEWQLEMTADLPFRVYEYHVLTAIALDAEALGEQGTPRVRSTVVLLSGRETPWPEHGSYRTSPDDEPFSGVIFYIDAVYQRTVAELEARGPLWTIFAPLAVDADPVRMKEVLERLRALVEPREFGELGAAMTVVAAKDKRRRGLHEAILPMLSKEDVMQSSVYQMGKQEGKQEGELTVLARVYERRLQRPLTEEERAMLAQRLEKLGADRLLDVPQALSSDALAAWLGDPAAKGHES